MLNVIRMQDSTTNDYESGQLDSFVNDKGGSGLIDMGAY